MQKKARVSRLCRNAPGLVTEASFQRTSLAFDGETQWLQHISTHNGTRVAIPRVTVTEGTLPAGSEWARVPFPECDDKPCTDAPQQCQKKRGLLDICDQIVLHAQEPPARSVW